MSSTPFPYNQTSMVDNLSSPGGEGATTTTKAPSALPVLLAGVLNGRFTFPEADPSSTSNWTKAKWKETLSLDTFDYSDEHALEVWADAQTPRLLAAAPSLRTLLAVLTFEADPAISTVFEEIAKLSLRTFEDVVDAFAMMWFTESHVASQLELGFFSLPRETSVACGHSSLIRAVRTYSYVAKRRGRANFLTAPFLADALLRCVPLVVMHRVHDKHPPILEFPSALAACQQAESQLRLRHNGILPPATTPVSYAVTNAPPSRSSAPPKGACYGCGDNHFRRDCPFLKARCESCQRLGHKASHCRTVVVKDSMGNPKVVLQPYASKVSAEFKLDKTLKDHLSNVENVVKVLIDKTLRKAEAAKSRRRPPSTPSRAASSRPSATPKPADAHVVLTEPEDNASDDDICYAGLAAIPLRKILTTTLHINGFPVSVCLDTGCEVDICPPDVSKALNLVCDPNAGTTSIRGFGDFITPSMTTSIPTSVQFPGQAAIQVRFKIGGSAKFPILISPRTISRLGCVIDFPNNCIVVGSSSFPLCFTTNTISQVGEGDDSEHLAKSTAESVRLAELPDAGKETLRQLLLQFADTWVRPQAGKCLSLTVNFKVKGRPRRFNPRPLSSALLREAHKQVDDLLKGGIIERCDQSAWASPIVMVPKKALGGVVRWRMAIDYRYVNRLLQDDNYPLPVITDLYNKLHNKRYFTCIDLNWGFWNVRLDPECQQYTAFTVPDKGIFSWKVLPFGMKTSPTEFQHAVELALASVLATKCVYVYIDDIIIATLTLDDHLIMLEHVLDALRRAKLYINILKTQFVRTSVKYLGSVLSYNQIRPDPAKVQGIWNATAPRDKNSLRSFLGAAGYMRQYIPFFSDVARPLTKLLGKGVAFSWGDDERQAFETIQSNLIGSMYLSIPDPQKAFVLFTDASDLGTGAVLAQESDDGVHFDFIAFASKTLNDTQQRWDTGEREMYAIVWACETFERYIRGIPTTVYTDHNNHEWPSVNKSPKVLRWSLRLQEYFVSVRYLKGEENVVADWLSRSRPNDLVLDEHMLMPVSYTAWQSSVPAVPTVEELAQATRAETGPHTRDIVWDGDVPRWHKSRRLYVPAAFRPLLMWHFHASPTGGHLGINRTVSRLKRYFGWPGLPADAAKFVKSCLLCNCFRRIPTHAVTAAGSMGQTTTFSTLSLDFIGPLNFASRGQRFIHVAIDHASRFLVTRVEASTPTAKSVLAFVQEAWIPYFGVPRTILTDRGTQYTADAFVSWVTQEAGIKLIHTPPYYPEANAINESSHQLLHHALKCQPADWVLSHFETAVTYAAIVHNSSPHPSLGTTPFEALFGKDMVLPGLQSLTPDCPDVDRKTAQRDRFIRQLFAHQLLRLDAAERPANSDGRFKVGDIVCYPLSPLEQEDLRHLTGCPKWNPRSSFPCRIVFIRGRQATLQPLWTGRDPRVAPLAQLRKLLPTAPRELKDLIPGVINTPTIPVLREPDDLPFLELPVAEPPLNNAEPTRKRRKIGQVETPSDPPPLLKGETPRLGRS